MKLLLAFSRSLPENSKFKHQTGVFTHRPLGLLNHGTACGRKELTGQSRNSSKDDSQRRTTEVSERGERGGRCFTKRCRPPGILTAPQQSVGFHPRWSLTGKTPGERQVRAGKCLAGVTGQRSKGHNGQGDHRDKQQQQAPKQPLDEPNENLMKQPLGPVLVFIPAG